jgi:hypothetical protein
MTFLVAICLGAGTGCAIHQKMPQPLTAAAVSRVQEALDARGAWVEYRVPGRPLETVGVERGSARRVGTVTPSLELVAEDPPRVIPLGSVRSIQVNDHLLGAVEGLAAGTLSGALVGGLWAPSGKSSCTPGADDCIGMDFSDEIFFTSIVVGALVGLAVGASVGQRLVYTF